MTKLRPEIVLLDSMMDLGDIEELANIFSKIDISGVVRCLYWSAPVAEILKNRYNLKIDFEYALDYLNQQDLEEIDARIGEWLCNWYKDKELKKYKEFIFYKDFSLSNFIDNELGNLFIYIMKNIIAMHKFIMKKDNYNYAMVISKTEEIGRAVV